MRAWGRIRPDSGRVCFPPLFTVNSWEGPGSCQHRPVLRLQRGEHSLLGERAKWLIQGLGKREKGPMIGFRCPFQGMFELQMQVFVRTGVGTTCFRAICGACETTDSPGHTLESLGTGCRGGKLSKHLKWFWAHTPTWDTTGFLEQWKENEKRATQRATQSEK